MIFQSFRFIIFFGITTIAVFCVPRKWQNGVLLCFNLVFAYFAGGVKTLVFLSFSALTTFFSAIYISKSKSQRAKKTFFCIPFILNILLLVVLKYSAFFIKTTPEFIRLIVPVGISFYTLWMLGYLLDVYWNSYEAEKNFLNYAVFATYFPLIISGPIVRYQNTHEQFSKERVLIADNVTKGILRVCWGFFQKMVIADNIARIVNQIYSNHTQYTGVYILFGTVCFAIQLYTDFCGCIDIVLGCSKILGINLPENFDAPFFSKSISEFWRRWHITLGTWFKDYLMYPLLKSRGMIALGDKSKKVLGKRIGKKIPVYCSLVVLWFSLGFWHGGAWKYIIGSGLLFCFYMIVSESMTGIFKKTKSFLHINESIWWWKGFQTIRTFLLVCSGFVFFRSNGVRHALNMYKNLCLPSNFFVAGFNSLLDDSNMSFMRFTVTCFSTATLFMVSLVKKTNNNLSQKIYENKVLTLILSLGLIGMIFLFAAIEKSSFIYFQF